MSMLRKLNRQISGIFQFQKALWRGLIIAAPILIIGWVLYKVLDAMNSIGANFLSLFVLDKYLEWGIGVLVILLFILVIGRIDVHFEGKGKSIWSTIKKKTVRRIPVLGSLFATDNQKVMSLEDFQALTPCKFWASDMMLHYGFIVNEQKVRGGETEIDVYRPRVPTIINGDLLPLKRRFVIRLGNSAGEILDKLASGGLISSVEEIPLPWEDESEADFRERMNSTPLEIALKKMIGEKLRDLYKGTSPSAGLESL